MPTPTPTSTHAQTHTHTWVALSPGKVSIPPTTVTNFRRFRESRPITTRCSPPLAFFPPDFAILTCGVGGGGFTGMKHTYTSVQEEVQTLTVTRNRAGGPETVKLFTKARNRNTTEGSRKASNQITPFLSLSFGNFFTKHGSAEINARYILVHTIDEDITLCRVVRKYFSKSPGQSWAQGHRRTKALEPQRGVSSA